MNDMFETAVEEGKKCGVLLERLRTAIVNGGINCKFKTTYKGLVDYHYSYYHIYNLIDSAKALKSKEMEGQELNNNKTPEAVSEITEAVIAAI